MPLPQPSPDPRFLDGTDGFLDALLEYSANTASDNGTAVAAVVIGAEAWIIWECFHTPYGHAVYLHPGLRFSPHRLVVTLADHREFAWSLHGITADGTVVLVMHHSMDPPLPMAYVVGRPPWKPYQWNFRGLLRFLLILLFSGTLLVLFLGFLSTFF